MSVDRATERRLKRVRDRIMNAVLAELDRGDVQSDELLAIMAHTTGACLAFQDQRKMTPQQGLKLIGDNIEAGNREAIAETLSAGGRPQ